MLKNRQQLGIGHVCYEIERLCECYERWLALQSRRAAQREMNDLIELVLLHARAVLDFFEHSGNFKKTKCNKGDTDDDIVADHYEWPARKIRIDRKVKTRINKEIAHLSYFRCGLTKEEKTWHFATFVPILLRQSREFLIHVDTRFAAELPSLELRIVQKCIPMLKKYENA